MAWPKLKSNVRDVPAAPIAPPSKPTIKTKLLVRVDKHMAGPFAGLYALSTIDKDGNETQVIDANTKRFIIIRMQKLMMGVD